MDIENFEKEIEKEIKFCNPFNDKNAEFLRDKWKDKIKEEKEIPFFSKKDEEEYFKLIAQVNELELIEEVMKNGGVDFINEDEEKGFSSSFGVFSKKELESSDIYNRIIDLSFTSKAIRDKKSAKFFSKFEPSIFNNYFFAFLVFSINKKYQSKLESKIKGKIDKENDSSIYNFDIYKFDHDHLTEFWVQMNKKYYIDEKEKANINLRYLKKQILPVIQKHVEFVDDIKSKEQEI